MYNVERCGICGQIHEHWCWSPAWKQTAKKWMAEAKWADSYGIEFTRQAQATADRRGVILKGALAVIEALQDHHCGGMCPEGHDETMNAANHYQEIIAKELGDA